MADIAIVVAETRGGLDAVVATQKLELMPDTVKECSSLSTFPSPGFISAGQINTGKGGFIGLAKVK